MADSRAGGGGCGNLKPLAAGVIRERVTPTLHELLVGAVAQMYIFVTFVPRLDTRYT